VSSIKLNGVFTTAIKANITFAYTETTIDVHLTDANEDKANFLYYAINEEPNVHKTQMNAVKGHAFTATIPATNQTGNVSYFFETSDNFGNWGNTSTNYYFADGEGPWITQLLVWPTIISNVTPVTILFNVSDPSGYEVVQFRYSTNNTVPWIARNPELIDYSVQIANEQIFVINNSESLNNNGTTYVTLNVKKEAFIAENATLTFTFTHEMSTDLRIWLILPNQDRILVFDREVVSTPYTRVLNLFNLGMTANDFNNANFTLEIRDYSSLYLGSLDAFTIVLKNYKIPLGYQFMVTVPETNDDTWVYYFFILRDTLGNTVNTTTYSYYSDGAHPVITLDNISSPLNLLGDVALHYSSCNGCRRPCTCRMLLEICR